MTHDEKIQRQIELEQKSRGDGQARYWRNYDKSVKKGQFSATAPGTDLMHTIVGRRLRPAPRPASPPRE